MRIYIAASVFTPFERRRNMVVADHLAAEGHDVFLPQALRTSTGERPPANEIFQGCMHGVDECDVVVGLVDGADVDSGTAWELGYARAKKKPVIALRTDYRGAEDGPVNIMIQFGVTALVTSVGPLDDESLAIQQLIEAVNDADRQVARSSGERQ